MSRPPKNMAPLRRYAALLRSRFGPQGWWPGEGPFEVVLGALLVQNTAWRNVERALDGMKARRLLSPSRLRRLSKAQLQSALRPAGTYRLKAEIVTRFLDYLFAVHGGSLKRMLGMPAWHLRADLLRLRGVGPETADSILLYAANKPVFVVGAYTRRILVRHGLVMPGADYDEVQGLAERQLGRDAVLYKEVHALLVETGKRFCRKRDPNCDDCPLRRTLPGGRMVRQ